MKAKPLYSEYGDFHQIDTTYYTWCCAVALIADLVERAPSYDHTPWLDQWAKNCKRVGEHRCCSTCRMSLRNQGMRYEPKTDDPSDEVHR